MNKQEAIEILACHTDETVVEIYDNNDLVQTALNFLIEGFEYPNYSHKTIQQVLLTYFNKNRKVFNIGKAVCHHALHAHCQERYIDLSVFFFYHSNMNWGMLTDDDQIANDIALATMDGRLLSKYRLIDGKEIYIITDFETEESPRYTTAMFIEDY